jgi:hypothetical protein
MTTALLWLLALGAADSLGDASVGAMKFKAPVSWKVEQTDAETKSWTSSDEKGAVSFYSGQLDKVRPAKACVDAMVAAVGVDGFEFAPIGAQPAAKKITQDFIGEKDADKTETNRVITTTWVGCDGKTKWLLTFSARKSEGARFGPVLRRMLDSITYGKAP